MTTQSINPLAQYLKSSIGKKQIVAVTGLMLVLFVLGHLVGNLLIFLGPEVYNSYAKKLAGLRPGLYVVEFGLAAIFLIHIYFTALIVMENIKARGVGYAVNASKGNRSFATKIMPYTGSIIFAFIIIHLLDFTFVDHYGIRSHLKDGLSLGVYGVVWNAFSSLWHSLFYVVAVWCLGFHLVHGVESVFQTFGYNHPVYSPIIKRATHTFALFVMVGYSAIPIYVLIKNALAH